MTAMDTYSYRSPERSGKIALTANHVECDVRQGFSRWKYQIPYSQLSPFPVRNQKTTHGFWVCLLVGGLGVIASATRLLRFDLSMPLSVAIPILVASLALLLFSTRIRTEQWISFHSVISNVSVFYCESGPHSNSFEQFTDILANRISQLTKHPEIAVQQNDEPKRRFGDGESNPTTRLS